MTGLTTVAKVPYPQGTDPLGMVDTYVKAVADWLEDAFGQRAKLYPNAALSPANATPTLVPFTGETLDPKNLHDNVTNNTRVTVTKAGWYRVTAQVMWATNNTGWRFVTLVANAAATVFGQQLQMAAQGTETRQQCTGTVLLGAGGYVQLQIAHSAGAALAIDPTATGTWFEVEWIGTA